MFTPFINGFLIGTGFSFIVYMVHKKIARKRDINEEETNKDELTERVFPEVRFPNHNSITF